MKNYFKYLILFLLSSNVAFAATDTATTATDTAATDIGIMTRAEFVDSQVSLLENVEKMQAEYQVKNDEMMKSSMPEEQYEQYKADQMQAEKTEKEAMAKCLGIDVAEIAEIEKKVDPAFQIGVVKECASKLPESINMAEIELETNSAFDAYTACAQEKAADAMGIAPQKLVECSQLDKSGK